MKYKYNKIKMGSLDELINIFPEGDYSFKGKHSTTKDFNYEIKTKGTSEIIILDNKILINQEIDAYDSKKMNYNEIRELNFFLDPNNMIHLIVNTYRNRELVSYQTGYCIKKGKDNFIFLLKGGWYADLSHRESIILNISKKEKIIKFTWSNENSNKIFEEIDLSNLSIKTFKNNKPTFLIITILIIFLTYRLVIELKKY